MQWFLDIMFNSTAVKHVVFNSGTKGNKKSNVCVMFSGATTMTMKVPEKKKLWKSNAVGCEE